MMAERDDSFTAGAPRRRVVLPPFIAGILRGAFCGGLSRG